MACQINPKKVEDEIKIGAAKIASLGKDFRAWSSAMKADFGENISPYLNQIYNHAQFIDKVATREANRPQIEARLEKMYKGRAEGLREKTERGDYAKEIRSEFKLGERASAAKQDWLDARKEYDAMVRSAELANQPAWYRRLGQFVELARLSKLTGIETMGKIAGAATWRIPVQTVNSVVNEVLRRIPGELGKAARQSGVSGAGIAELPAFYKGFARGIKEIPQVMSGAIGREGKAYPSSFKEGSKIRAVSELASIRLHQAGKHPARMASQSLAEKFYTKEFQRLGKDVTNPDVISEIKELSTAEGYRSIFLKDNLISRGLNIVTSSLEHQKGQFDLPGKVAAQVIRFLQPIVKVPTNIGIESARGAGIDTVVGPLKALRVMAKGADNMPTWQKEMYVRSIKRGMIGPALIMLGYANRDKLGGFHQQGHERGQGELAPMEANIGGVKIPAYLWHAPYGMLIQFGADMGHQMDGEKGKSAPEAWVSSEQQMFREIPLLKEATIFDQALGAGWKKFAGQQVKGLIPQNVQNIAKWTDEHDDEGYPVQRKTKGFTDTIMTAIPGLRGRSSEFTEEKKSEPVY